MEAEQVSMKLWWDSGAASHTKVEEIKEYIEFQKVDDA